MADTTEVVLDLHLPVTRIDLPRYTRENEVSNGSSDGLNFDDVSLSVPSFSRHAFVMNGQRCDMAVRVLGDGFDTEITPLAFKHDQLGGDGAKISLHCPYKVLSQCVQLTETEDGVLLTLVTINGLLYTVKIHKSRFSIQVDCSSPNSSTVSTEIISEYHAMLKNAFTSYLHNQSDLLVSVSNGDLVSINLDEQKLTYLINHEKPGFFKRMLGGATNETVPGHSDISMSTVTCMSELNESLIISYAIDSSIQIWDLNALKAKKSVSKPSVLKLRPSQNVCVSQDSIFVGHANKLDVYNLNLELQNSIEYPKQVENWFVSSILYFDNVGTVVAFKMNLDAWIMIFNGVEWTPVSHYDPFLSLELADDISVECICERVLQIDLQILKTCLYKLVPTDEPVIASLSHSELPAYLGNLFYGPEETQKWAKFENMCREVYNESNELLGLFKAEYADVYAVNVNSTKLVKHEELPTEIKANITELDSVITNLFTNFAAPALIEFGEVLTARNSAVQCLEQTCQLFKPVLDQSKLNETASKHGSSIVNSISAFRHFYGPLTVSANANSNASTAKSDGNERLTSIGKLAIGELVHTYARETEQKFLYSAALAAIAIIEGWDDSEKCSLEFERAVQEYKLVSFYNLFSTMRVNVQLKLDFFNKTCLDADLSKFGPLLAQQLLSKFDKLDALAWLLLMPEFSAADITKFYRLSGMISPSAKLWFIKGLAALKAGEELEAEKLFRRVSIARPWIPMLGSSRPLAVADWYACLAEYAYTLNAVSTSFQLAITASTLATTASQTQNGVHLLLFKLAVQNFDYDTAYTALTRRFTTEDSEAKAWIEQLLDSASTRGFELVKQVLTQYVYTGFALTVAEVLKSKPLFGAVQSYKLLYTWHVARKDYAAAAEVVYTYAKETGLDPKLERDLLIVCMNALELVHSKDRFIWSSEGVVTYDDVKNLLANSQ